MKNVLPNSVKNQTGDFTPDWDSLDRRKLPDWYEDAKFGIFVHWGIYSVPAYKSEWFWWHLDGDHKSEYQEYMKNNYPHYSYQVLDVAVKHLYCQPSLVLHVNFTLYFLMNKSYIVQYYQLTKSLKQNKQLGERNESA